MKNNFLITLLAAFSIAANAQDSLNITKIGHLDYTEELSDVRGCVVNGREYALVGAHSGFSIVDVTDPSSPNEVLYEAGPSTDWRDAFEYNGYMYGVNDNGGGGMVIINMNPLPQSNNLPVTYYTGNTYSFSVAHNIFIDENGYAYLFGANNGNGGAIILDLNQNPTAPVEVGRFDDYYIHDGFVRGDTLWAACVYAGFVAVIDVSDKANPAVLTTFNTPSNVSHNVWPSDDNKYAFTTDEVSAGYIAAYDVSDFQNISYLDAYQSHPGTSVIPHNAHYINGFLVNSNYRSGLTILDANNPTSLVEVGYYDTSPNFSGNGFNGCWGAWPFLPSGNILASDIETGLYILSFDYVQACYLKGLVTDINTSIPLNGVDVTIISTTVADSTNITGNYATGYHQSGTYTVEFSKGGYITETITGVSLSNGVTTTLDVQMIPDVPFAMQGKVVDSQTNQGIPFAFVKLQNNYFTHDIQADANGNFDIASFYAGNYDLIAGQWNYITQCNTELITSSSGVVTIPLDKGIYDDFSFDFGWTVTGNAATGDWERVDPVGTSFQNSESNPEDDVADDCSDLAYITGNGGGDAGDDDIDDGATILTSPTFDLTGYTNPRLHFKRWFFNDGGSQGSTPNDLLKVILDNGQTSVVLEQVDFNSPGNSSWQHRSYLVKDAINPTAQMKLIVEAADNQPGHLVEAGFDHFFVEEYIGDGIGELNNPTVRAWPNPFTNEINIELLNGKGTYQLSLVDVSGRLILQKEVSGSNQKLTLQPEVAKGLYFLNIQGENGLIESVKIIRH